MLAALCLASLTSQQQVHAQQKDYSKGFKMFYDYGLPNVSKATYVKLDISEGHAALGDGWQLMSQSSNLRLAGNAWMLEEKDGKGRFVVGDCVVAEVYDARILAQERKAKLKAVTEKPKAKAAADDEDNMEEMMGMGVETRAAGVWKKADLKADVDKVLKFAREQKKKAGPDDDDRMMTMAAGGMGFGFLMAIHVHSQGLTNEANEMVDILLKMSKEPRQVVQNALNRLADVQYSQMCDKFFSNGAWDVFGTDLTNLVARFSRGWGKGELVKRVAASVLERAGQKEPPPLVGEGLTEEDQALARELAVSTNVNPAYLSMHSGQIWVLPSTEGVPVYFGRDTNSAMARIVKRGMKSVPMLMAMLKDKYLMRVDMMRHSGWSGSGYEDFDFMSSRMGAEYMAQMQEQMYRSMRRPFSRGELARSLLTPLPFRKDDRQRSEEETDPDELIATCAKWYEKVKGKSGLDIARMYMNEGDQSQRSVAMQILLASGTDDDAADLEKRFLETKRPSDVVHYAQQYVEKRGEKAAAFVEKFTEMIKKKEGEKKKKRPDADDLADLEDMEPGEARMSWADQAVESMKLAVSPQGAKEIMDGVVEGKLKWEQAYGALNKRLATQKPGDALTLVLDATLRAKDAKIACGILSMAQSIPYLKGQTQMMQSRGGVPAKAEPVKFDIKSHLDQWKKLIQDKRVVKTEVYNEPYWRLYAQEDATVSKTAAQAIESIYAEQTKEPRGAYAAYRGGYAAYGGAEMHLLGGGVASRIVQERAEARLAGKKEDELPKYPSAENLTEAQRKQLVEKLIGAADSALRAALSALTLDENLALIAEANDNEPLGRKLVGVLHTVNKVEAKLPGEEAKKKIEASMGKRLSKEAVELVFDIAKQLVADGNAVRFSIHRMPHFEGVAIGASAFPSDSETGRKMQKHAGGGSGSKAMIQAMLSAHMISAHSMWQVAMTATNKPEEKKDAKAADTKTAAGTADADTLIADVEEDASWGEGFADQQKDFWEKVGEFLEGKGNVCVPASIEIWGAPPMKPEKTGVRSSRRFSGMH